MANRLPPRLFSAYNSPATAHSLPPRCSLPSVLARLTTCDSAEAAAILQPILDEALAIVLPLAKALDPTDTGVVLEFWRGRIDVPTSYGLTVLRGGVVPDEKDHTYARNANRKRVALVRNPDFISTFQCVDEANDLHGGGVKFFWGTKFRWTIILAPSGLAPWFDEMLGCIIAMKLDLGDMDMIEHIVRTSSNPHLLAYLNTLGMPPQED